MVELIIDNHFNDACREFRALFQAEMESKAADLAGDCVCGEEPNIDSGGHSYEGINKNKGVFSNEC